MTSDFLIRHLLEGFPVLEAVEDLTNAGAVLTRYHYQEDPRHTNRQPGKDIWFTHPDGHQVFVCFDPSDGIRWQAYQNHKKSSFGTGGSNVSFLKGAGAYTLESLLSSMHEKGSE